MCSWSADLNSVASGSTSSRSRAATALEHKPRIRSSDGENMQPWIAFSPSQLSIPCPKFLASHTLRESQNDTAFHPQIPLCRALLTRLRHIFDRQHNRRMPGLQFHTPRVQQHGPWSQFQKIVAHFVVDYLIVSGDDILQHAP